MQLTSVSNGKSELCLRFVREYLLPAVSKHHIAAYQSQYEFVLLRLGSKIDYLVLSIKAANQIRHIRLYPGWSVDYTAMPNPLVGIVALYGDSPAHVIRRQFSQRSVACASLPDAAFELVPRHSLLTEFGVSRTDVNFVSSFEVAPRLLALAHRVHCMNPLDVKDELEKIAASLQNEYSAVVPIDSVTISKREHRRLTKIERKVKKEFKRA